MHTGTQFNQWLDNQIETLYYSGNQLEQFKIDSISAMGMRLYIQFIEAITAFPDPINH